MRARTFAVALAGLAFLSTGACSLYFASPTSTRDHGDDDDDDDGPSDEVPYACPGVTPLAPFSTYLKASNTGAWDQFGSHVAISADGSTIAIAAFDEASSATGVNGSQDDDNTSNAGAVYVFARHGATWSQQAYLKSGFRSSGNFGLALSISADGSTIVVGQPWAPTSGVAFVFQRTGTAWALAQTLTAATPHDVDFFGAAVAISGDGHTIAIGAPDENSIGSPGPDQTFAGAVHMFTKTTSWTETASFAAANTAAGDSFGGSVALSHSGATVVIGALGANGSTGTAYVFRHHANGWVQEAQLEAANADVTDYFGMRVAITSDGNTVAVGAPREDGEANSMPESGAAYVFTRYDDGWSQTAYLRATNADGGDGPPLGSGSSPGGSDAGDSFGSSPAFSPCGSRLIVGAPLESSAATGLDGDSTDDSAPDAGAAYVFTRDETSWKQTTYVKASNTGAGDEFGSAVAISEAGAIVVGAHREQSAATGIDGNAQDNSAMFAGAAYALTVP